MLSMRRMLKVIGRMHERRDELVKKSRMLIGMYPTPSKDRRGGNEPNPLAWNP